MKIFDAVFADGRRKVVLALLIEGIATVALFTGQLPADQWVYTTMAIFGSFSLANAVEHVSQR